MVQDRNAGRSKTPVKQALLKGVYGVLTNTLLARFGTYHALLFLQSKAPDVAKAAAQHKDKVSLVLFLLLLVTAASERFRRNYADTIMRSLSLLSAFSLAFGSGTRGHMRYSSLEDISWQESAFGNVDVNQFLHITVDLQPTMYAAVSAGVTAALLLPSFPGSSLLAIATAAGAPYLQTRIWAAWAGWASLSLAAKIGAGLSGAFSAIAVWWLLSTVRKMVNGRTIFGNPVKLRNAVTGTDPSDHAYIAVTAFTDLLLMPLWVLLLWARTWIWMVTLGTVFSGRKKED